MMFLLKLSNSNPILRLRMSIARWRRKHDPWYRRRIEAMYADELVQNAPYERGEEGLFYPPVLNLEQTMRKVIDEKVSVCRYGDGEFEIVDGQKDKMTFQDFDHELQQRLREILGHPIAKCLCCIPDVYGSLDRYSEPNRKLWRRVAIWSRARILPLMADVYRQKTMVLGDAMISRPYLDLRDKAMARKIFDLWKELFSGKDLLIVEGRYSRLGVGNDLFAGAKSVRRIWCPPTNAFGRYEEILAAVRQEAKPDDLVLLAVGMTATVLAYDLARFGYWAVDAGHIDIEYIWMRMGVERKVAVPGRYVNECQDGHERVREDGEIDKYHVVGVVDS